MKLFSKNLFTLILVCLCSTITQATEGIRFSVKTAYENSFIIEMDTPNHAPISVVLKHEEGANMYSEILDRKTNGIKRRYDISQIPNGNYTLVVASENVIRLQPITKNQNSVVLKAEELITINQPTLKQHDQFLDINMLCNFDYNLEFQISDNAGRIIYSELENSRMTFQKRFNLSKLVSGTYQLNIRIRDSILVEIIEKEINWESASLASN